MSKTEKKYITSGEIVKPISIPEGLISETIEPQIYVVKYSDMSGYYLQIKGKQFDLPSKLYGTVEHRATRVISTYTTRESSTGVLAVGDKGAGKSLLSKLICNKAVTELGLPVLVIEHPYSGSDFNRFIEDIGDCVLFFDEFGKTYASFHDKNDNHVDNQEDLLSLMDGHVKGKYLFLVTENNERDINEYMKDRPGRLYYRFRYKKLEEAAILDYCQDKGVSEDNTTEIIAHVGLVKQFSFDMLAAIVTEHLTYDSPISEVVEVLNISLPYNSYYTNQKSLIIEKVIDKKTKEEIELVSYYLDSYSTNNSFAITRIADADKVQNPFSRSANSIDFYKEQLQSNTDNTVVYDNTTHILVGKIQEYSPSDYSEYLA